jgi:simple sugar transport system permease protein
VTPETQERLATALRVVVPAVLAFGAGAIILLLLGTDPLAYYGYVLKRGLLSWGGLQETLTRTAPLLLIAAGLIVAFRAGLWNLGGDGQFLLAAVVTAGLGPVLIGVLPRGATLIACMAAGALTAALWSLIPGVLKARYGVNEVVSSLMMSFLGTSFANLLVKTVLRDRTTAVPKTPDLSVADRLPPILGNVHLGVLIALVAVVLTHLAITRTAFGLKLQVLGANPAVARHAGLDVTWLTIASFALSAALIGLGGSIEILGVWGTVRADWNPAFGLLVVPIVFLARLNGYAVIIFTMCVAVLMIGGESAARRLGVQQHFVWVLLALLLIFLALLEHFDQLRRARRAL